MLNLIVYKSSAFCISVLLLFSCSSNKTLSFTNLKSKWDIDYIKCQADEEPLLSFNNDLLIADIEHKKAVTFSVNNFKNKNKKKTVFKNILIGNDENKVETSSIKEIQFKTNWLDENKLIKENNKAEVSNEPKKKHSKKEKTIIVVFSVALALFIFLMIFIPLLNFGNGNNGNGPILCFFC